MTLYSFKDVKIGFMEPFLQANDNVAIRTFKTTLNDVNNVAGRYKEDIELWKIADWNEFTGETIPNLNYIMGGKDIEERK